MEHILKFKYIHLVIYSSLQPFQSLTSLITGTGIPCPPCLAFEPTCVPSLPAQVSCGPVHQQPFRLRLSAAFAKTWSVDGVSGRPRDHEDMGDKPSPSPKCSWSLAIDPRRPELKFKLENRGVADIVALLSQGMAVDGLAVDGSSTVTDAFQAARDRRMTRRPRLTVLRTDLAGLGPLGAGRAPATAD